jgi:hypothetical protein
MKRLLLSLLIFGGQAHASTFVGNGGGAGDIELGVTKAQIKEAFAAVDKRRDEELDWCTCKEEYAGRSICEALNGLSEKQSKYCSKAMRSQAADIVRLVQDKGVVVQWTRDTIEVGEHKRAVDAVTDPQKRTITVNLERFLDMKPYERIFLLTHEYLHLSKFNGKLVDDAGPEGPFEGEEGGRKLLNAMAAATSVTPWDLPKEVKTYSGRLKRSQAWKPWWIEAGGGKAAGDNTGTFSSDDFDSSEIDVRYVLGNFMIAAGSGQQRSHFQRLGSVDVEEVRQIVSVGAGYRFFFFRDPMTYWGQSHLVTLVSAEYLNAKLDMHDAFTASDEKVSKFGASLSARYYFPVLWGIWGFAGAKYEYLPYSYDTVNVKYKGGTTSSYLGVSYAF